MCINALKNQTVVSDYYVLILDLVNMGENYLLNINFDIASV